MSAWLSNDLRTAHPVRLTYTHKGAITAHASPSFSAARFESGCDVPFISHALGAAALTITESCRRRRVYAQPSMMPIHPNH